MSTFDPGTSGTLKSDTLPEALMECAIKLSQAELSRNAANPGVPAQNRITVACEFDGNTSTITAAIPVGIAIDGSTGKAVITATDYLGSAYSTFANGGGDLASSNLVAAFMELSQLVSSAELAMDVATRANNITIAYDPENLLANISAALPFTATLDTAGAVKVVAQDYLP